VRVRPTNIYDIRSASSVVAIIIIYTFANANIYSFRRENFRFNLADLVATRREQTNEMTAPRNRTSKCAHVVPRSLLLNQYLSIVRVRRGAQRSGWSGPTCLVIVVTTRNRISMTPPKTKLQAKLRDVKKKTTTLKKKKWYIPNLCAAYDKSQVCCVEFAASTTSYL